MRQRHEYDTKRGRDWVGIDEATTKVSLYNDYAYIEQGCHTFNIGKVQRIVLSGQYGRKDYTAPVEYAHPNRDKLTVFISPYVYGLLSVKYIIIHLFVHATIINVTFVGTSKSTSRDFVSTCICFHTKHEREPK